MGCPATGQRTGDGEAISRFPNGKPLNRHDVAAPWDGIEGDWEAGPLYVGATVELVHDVKSVAQIVSEVEVEVEAEAALDKIADSRTAR
ncbi:hypothetical protein [Paraburkholderia fungorum]|uniref:hypothetical protein n=1 Tax=Paraburkholderia fungorum TaxID=134537 RepID=UPI0038BA4256